MQAFKKAKNLLELVKLSFLFKDADRIFLNFSIAWSN